MKQVGKSLGLSWEGFGDASLTPPLPGICRGNWECGRIGRWKERYREGERPQAMAAVRERWTGHRKELAG